METQRDEVYERIPWETLEKRSGDRQWMVYAVAGAVVLGALAFSFARNAPSAAAPVIEAAPSTTVPTAASLPAATAPAAQAVSPMVVAEADLYAVEPERLVDLVSAQAEWFAIEYMSVDGTEEGRRALESLLPSGAPLPEPPEGVQVFVDWVETMRVSQSGPTTYDVGVIVRSLSSSDGTGFTRRPATMVTVEVEVTAEGDARVIGLPVLSEASMAPRADLSMVDAPADLAGRVSAEAGRVVGGVQQPDGTWALVVMQTGPDGVARPALVYP